MELQALILDCRASRKNLNPVEFCPTHELFLAHLHPDDRPVFKAAIEGALSTRSPYDYELRIVRADRSLRAPIECTKGGHTVRAR